MDTLTTYSARRASVLVWLAAALHLTAAVSRVWFFADAGSLTPGMVTVRIILPIAANLILAIRLPLHGEKQFYVTVNPMFLILIYLISCVDNLSSVYLWACAILLCGWYVVYARTYKGKLRSNAAVLVMTAVMGGILYLCDAVTLNLSLRDAFPSPGFPGVVSAAYTVSPPPCFADSMLALAVLLTVLCAKRLPDPKEGEPYRLHYGDRLDGRQIHNNSPMNKLNPYFMPTRNQASNYISDKVEISNIENYIRQKRRDGMKHFGITHVILATYVRCCAELPGVNRFLAGQKIFHRYDVVVSMVIKKEWDVNAPDTVIKVHFDPADTAEDIYRKYDEVLQSVRTPSLDSGFDKATKLIDYIPGLVKKFGVWMLKVLDYFAVLPAFCLELSPFHGSLFITSMGSLGIPPIYHHLYDFGNIPAFCSFGCKRTEYELDSTGKTVAKKYIDYKFVTDERIIDGFYYAAVLKRFRSLMNHPERLDEPHEVKEDVF